MSVSRTVTVKSSQGLHARPAKLFVDAVAESGAQVTVAKGEKSMSAASILGVLALGIESGDEVTLTVDGDNEESVLETLVDFLSTDHEDA